MKPTIILACLGMILTATSCKKAPANLQENLPQGAVLQSGVFVSSTHPTSGMAKVVDSVGKKFLVFENFSTDNGPALEVWLSKNTGVAEYRNLGALKAASGQFSYELSTDQNTTVFNHVLIWCERFSVLFGYSVLR